MTFYPKAWTILKGFACIMCIIFVTIIMTAFLFADTEHCKELCGTGLILFSFHFTALTLGYFYLLWCEKKAAQNFASQKNPKQL